ncbi:hypothetical protein [Tuwongella immobilis]|uniref:Uncharacterized protein n=1 Tax=Tuwongella immobilis TaxID=692036 RepID=A0A6C2YJA4_9BACT|nr:hypothetical protein [Tuwongella immobilis]VIP01650.1 Uncharacterized protein OS=Ralstonia pickettii (strain 12D) GN=Rpic12D_2676 PE=4 SV=1 [Tuwongella immobilis]VTR99038.1 Uncharacterized protein OS=Ralstonia pickettii (strain 12D) GN=Rpic12D_2676 PE=4 SV=1 [Tuwongella immobilis]
MQPETTQLFDRLSKFKWFANVGTRYPEGADLLRANSWEDSLDWCQNPLTEWANIQGGLLLYSKVSTTNDTRFLQWNQVARSLIEPTQRLMESVILPAIPLPKTPQPITNIIMSHISGSLIECEYRDCAPEIQLFNTLLKYYEKGHFPCGWVCNHEDDFPDKAIIVLW